MLDNYQHPLPLIELLLAANGAGHVILTTRGQTAARVPNTLQLKALPLEESMLLLLRRARLIAPNALLDDVPSDLLSQANAIATAVGGLPLALDQIGAYGAETQESMVACLTLLQKAPLVLFARRGTLVASGETHADSLASTYMQLFDVLGHLHPLSLDLLRVLAFLPMDRLPENVLRSGASALEVSSQRVFRTQFPSIKR